MILAHNNITKKQDTSVTSKKRQALCLRLKKKWIVAFNGGDLKKECQKKVKGVRVGNHWK